MNENVKQIPINDNDSIIIVQIVNEISNSSFSFITGVYFRIATKMNVMNRYFTTS